MNAIVALCHFCEAHGPCILLCTQAFHQSKDAQLLLDSAPLDRRGPRLDVHMEPHPLSTLMHPVPKSSDQCDACRSLPSGQPGYISYDEGPQITYITSQYPEQPQLYSILRQACVRSLNCEVCPGREGPIVFGEDNSCHTLSHTFKLSDKHSRGFSRLYSFIIVMRDRVFLINSWPFLVRHLRGLIDTLQQKADKVYKMESEDHKLTSSSSYGLDHLRRIRTNQSYRSLGDIIGDNDVYMYLHKYFVYLLKTGGKRMMECIVEGPPQAMAVSESMKPLTDIELIQQLDKPVSSSEFRVIQFDSQPVFVSIRHLLKVLGNEGFMELAYHIMRGDQLIVRGSDPSTVMSVLYVLKDLVPDSCCRIVGFSAKYIESYLCEFLGLSVGVDLSRHIVDSELHVLLDILPPLKRYYSLSDADHLTIQQQQSSLSDVDVLEEYKLMVYSAQPAPQEGKYPLIIQRLMSVLLTNETFSNTIVLQAIQSLKEEWMNKVKVLYKFSQIYSKDSQENDERFNKLLREVLHVTYEDVPILKHWRSALRKDYRTHLLLTNSKS